MTSEWHSYIAVEYDSEIASIIEEEKLKPGETRELMARAFKDGGVPETGTAIANLMTKKPSRFAPQNAYATMKARIIDRLKVFYERFCNLGVD